MRVNKLRIAPLLSVLPMVLVAVCLLAVAGCSDSDKPVVVDMSRREPLVAPRQVDAITYAYLPQYSHTISFQRHRKMLEYLRRETGLRLRQIFPDTFDEHVKMVARGEIDISYSNPLVYLRLADAGAQAFARIVEPNGEPNFRGTDHRPPGQPGHQVRGRLPGQAVDRRGPRFRGRLSFRPGLFLRARHHA